MFGNDVDFLELVIPHRVVHVALVNMLTVFFACDGRRR